MIAQFSRSRKLIAWIIWAMRENLRKLFAEHKVDKSNIPKWEQRNSFNSWAKSLTIFKKHWKWNETNIPTLPAFYDWSDPIRLMILNWRGTEITQMRGVAPRWGACAIDDVLLRYERVMFSFECIYNILVVRHELGVSGCSYGGRSRLTFLDMILATLYLLVKII